MCTIQFNAGRGTPQRTAHGAGCLYPGQHPDRRHLPPYGAQYLAAPPSAGLCIAIGPDAWDYAKKKPFAVLVVPDDNQPSDYRWPSHPGGALIFERGIYDNHRLTAMATELLVAGSPFVVAIREALLDDDPQTFFYAEADNVEA